MNELRDVIKAPIITEKAAELAQNNVYVFSVAIDANKTEVKQAIEKVFNVKVENVNIVNVRAKKKRVGKYPGKTSRVKKAIVKLAPGSAINLG